MNEQAPLHKQAHKLDLQRRDVLLYEHRLCQSLRLVFSFEKHAIYFPPKPKKLCAEYLPDEDKVLIPLFFQKAFYGVFMARGLFLKEHDEELEDDEQGIEYLEERPQNTAKQTKLKQEIERLLPSLCKIASLALENIWLYKHSQLDISTGLATRHSFMEAIRHEIERTRLAFSQQYTTLPSNASQSSPHTYLHDIAKPSGGLGLIVFCFAPLENLDRIDCEAESYLNYEYLQALANVLCEHCPEHALATCLDTHSLALLLPGEGRLACSQKSEQILQHLNAVSVNQAITQRRVQSRVFAGYAIYPHDLDALALRDVLACAHILVHRASLAASMARNHQKHIALSYARLLHEGGSIEEILPLGRIRINIGRSMGVREGQRFVVAGEKHGYKGELLIVDCREQKAYGEYWKRADTHLAFEQGDRLSLVQNPQESWTPTQEELSPEAVLSYRDMIPHLALHAQQGAHFALMLVDFPQYTHDAEAYAQEAFFAENKTADHVADLCKAGEIIQKSLQSFSDNPGLALCRFSNHAFMAFVPLKTHYEASQESPALALLHGSDPIVCNSHGHPFDNRTALYHYGLILAENLEQQLGTIPAIGLACWPFIDLRPADMLEAVRQSTHYAALLPYPHIGMYDSLAATMHADALYCQGDTFNAIEMYKRALIIDKSNALAWNSLGVCVSGLLQHNEARRHFEEALRHSPNDASIAYNLGAVCQTLRDFSSAKEAFALSLRLAPNHPYALIRLGQLALEEGDFSLAFEKYNEVAQIMPNSALPYRYLAQWALRFAEFFQAEAENNDRKETQEEAESKDLALKELGLEGADTKGLYDKAREYGHLALSKDSWDVPSLALMAGLYLDGGEDPALAESLARQCVALSPRYTKAWRILAQALSVQGHMREAREAYLRAAAGN